MSAPEDPREDWLRRFERAGWGGRLGLLAGTTTRLAATLAERALDRAASIAVEAHDAFRKELDPNVSDARILEEHVDPPARRTVREDE